eukprot:14949183-Heterocapsa_arctica.AAC.1
MYGLLKEVGRAEGRNKSSGGSRICRATLGRDVSRTFARSTSAATAGTPAPAPNAHAAALAPS